MTVTPPRTWPGGAPDEETAHRILVEYLSFMKGETVTHASLVRLLRNQYGWTETERIEEVLERLVATHAFIVREEVFCCCAPVPCYRILDDCASIRSIAALLAASPNKDAFLSLPHVASCL